MSLSHNYYRALTINPRNFAQTPVTEDMYQLSIQDILLNKEPVSSFQWNERINRVTVPAACFLYIRTKGQTIQTVLPPRHTVQWQLCLSHVPSDKVPSSPGICQPAASSTSQERKLVASLAGVWPPRWMLCHRCCHMPADGGGAHKPCLDTHGQINVRLTQQKTYVTQTCKKHMMDKEQQYKPCEAEIFGTCVQTGGEMLRAWPLAATTGIFCRLV